MLSQRFVERVTVLGVVGIAAHDDPAEAAHQARELGAANLTVFDSEHGTAHRWGVSGEPTILILDARGHVVRERCFIELSSTDNGRLLEGDELLATVEARLSAELDALVD